MRTPAHQAHIDRRIAHNNCPECRADNERSFCHPQWPGYQHIADYLAYVRPRLEAVRSGNYDVRADWWYREFVTALHRRITLKSGAETGRKRCGGYLERLRMATGGRNADAAYLRRFAQSGASCLYR